jgi:hypothetical protein
MAHLKTFITYRILSKGSLRVFFVLFFLFSSILWGIIKPIPAFAGSDSIDGYIIYVPLLSSDDSGFSPPELPSPKDGWLAYLNYYRAVAGLQPVTENKSWGEGDWYHSRYIVKNNVIGHEEDPSNEWYTDQGDLAARSSNLLASQDKNSDDLYAIDSWIQAPFHAVMILNPALQQVGYGSYRSEDGGFQMAASLDVIRGVGALPSSVRFPVIWPANGTTIPLGEHWGEDPDPLTSCPGYKAPSGIPVILQIGPGNAPPVVTDSYFKHGNKKLEHCLIDGTNYMNPDPADRDLGRSILSSSNAIVLIPRIPLAPGMTYEVSITASGQEYRWSFSITEKGASTTRLSLDGSQPAFYP